MSAPVKSLSPLPGHRDGSPATAADPAANQADHRARRDPDPQPPEHSPRCRAGVLAGAAMGELINIEGGLTRLGDALQRRLTGHQVPIEVSTPEAGGPGPHAPRFARGFGGGSP